MILMKVILIFIWINLLNANFICDFDKNDNCGGNLTSNIGGSFGIFRTDETISADSYTITDITSICK